MTESEEQKKEKIEEKWPVEHYQVDQHRQRRKRENIRSNVQKRPKFDQRQDYKYARSSINFK